MIAESKAPQIDPDLFDSVEDHRQGPDRLWRETLCLLLRDAMNHHRGAKAPGCARAYELEQAYDDVARCGPMLH